ncbi:MAG: hypothetical protein EU529_16830 [Promethearchaeota archaeon]|nr:MAG: hypothetical protein EU529_16830 [Candidatus Lokiarchaeota archaeon]
MLELIYQEPEINTRDQITIDIIKDGKEFLEQFELNQRILLDSISIIYRFLKLNGKIPHNLYKFFIGAYYIVSRHPWTFPAHENKKKFCRKFGIQTSSLDYSVEKIVGTLHISKILDDKNYPYYLDKKNDVGFKLAKSVVKSEVDKAMMEFLICNQPINSQILSEELINKIIFDMKIFPEELFRQFYEIILELVEDSLHEYYEYVQLQHKCFI